MTLLEHHVDPTVHCGTCTCNETKKNPVEPLPVDHGFAQFWAIYPNRPGKPKGIRKQTLESWKKLTLEQRRQAYRAAETYGINQAGYTKDAERFLRTGLWKEWVDVAPQVQSDRPSWVPAHAVPDGSGGWLA